MMRRMRKSTVGAIGVTLALVACGGGGKQADSPGNCPEGTVLRGSDCVPPEAAGDSSGEDSPAPKKSARKPTSDDDAPMGDSAPSGSSGDGSYDKEAVSAQLKRAAKQIKANCGSASDEEGKKAGPWGTTQASVTLGRNGHVKQVTIPAPYDGKPVGICVVRAFQRIQFPPYASSSDATVQWDVELVQPK
jgi:hypothetical protein